MVAKKQEEAGPEEEQTIASAVRQHTAPIELVNLGTVSMPKAPEPAAVLDWPEQIDDEPIYRKGTWSGLDQWTCLWKVRRIRGDQRRGDFYELPCRQTFFSEQELMEHIRDDH